MKRSVLTAVLFLLVLFSNYAFAQKNELGLLAGATFSPDNSTAVSFQGNYGRRIVDFHAASLYLELPVVGVTRRDGPSNKFVDHFSSIFFTPSLKVKLLPVLLGCASAGVTVMVPSPAASVNVADAVSWEV